jgi:hypothetical protein
MTVKEMRAARTPEQVRRDDALRAIIGLYGLSPFNKHSYVNAVIKEMGEQAFTLEALEAIAKRQVAWELRDNLNVQSQT